MNTREKWKNQRWEGKPGIWVGPGEGCQGYWMGGGGAPECPVLLSGWHGVTGSVCLWAGKASIPAADTPEMLLEGAYTDSAAAACSSLWMLQVPAGFPGSENPRNQHCLLTNHRRLFSFVHSSFINLFHFLFLFTCLFQHLPILLTIPVFPIFSQSLIFVQAFVHSPTNLSLKSSSAALLMVHLSPSFSLGTNRALSKPSKDMYALALCFCARCQSGLHTAGKGSRAQLLVARGQSRRHWQINAFIRMSLVAGAWTGVVFSSQSSHADRSWNYLQCCKSAQHCLQSKSLLNWSSQILLLDMQSGARAWEAAPISQQFFPA